MQTLQQEPAAPTSLPSVLLGVSCIVSLAHSFPATESRVPEAFSDLH